MVFDSYVFIREQDLPTAVQWVQAIGQSTFDLTMPLAFALPDEQAHFIPCDVENVASGFDLSISKADFEEFCFDSPQLAQIGDRHWVVNFRTYENAQEVAGMVIASGVLADSFNGVIVSDLNDDLVLAGHSTHYISSNLDTCRKLFDGTSEMRDAYDPDDPTANTIPDGNKWLGLALLVIVAIALAVLSATVWVSNIFGSFSKKAEQTSDDPQQSESDDDLAQRRP